MKVLEFPFNAGGFRHELVERQGIRGEPRTPKLVIMKDTPMNEDQEREEIEIILPKAMRAELEARAAKCGLEPAVLIDEVGERAMRKSPAYREEMIEIARAILKARELGIEPLWPESFEDRIVVGSLLSLKFKDSFPDYLLELEGPAMDIVEFSCKKQGISYEEFMRRAIDAFLAKGSEDEPDPEDEDDQDEAADWWKAR